jgi:hypothetical protein
VPYPYEPLIDTSDPVVMRERVMAMNTAARSGYFWEACPLCGLDFGGQEWLRGTIDKPSSIPTSYGMSKGICPFCTMAGRGAEEKARKLLYDGPYIMDGLRPAGEN